MAVQTMTPASWVKALEKKLGEQQRAIALPERYYLGRHRLEFATVKFRETFGSLFSALSVNWCPLVVDSAAERLRVEGFSFGRPDVDREAWQIWQENNFDVEARIIHTEAIKCGMAFSLVEPPATPGDEPRIYSEHASQMVVSHDPENRNVIRAAMKKWVDDDTGYVMATLYLPDAIYKLISQQRSASTAGGNINWRERQPSEGNPMRVVPVVPFYNKPAMLIRGTSDLHDVIPIQDLINKLIADMIVDSETVAFPQRVAIGWEVPKDPETKQPLPGTELRAVRSKLWAFSNPDVKVQQLQGAALDGYVRPIGMLHDAIAAVGRIPAHYMAGKLANVSGDALTADEATLVMRSNGKREDFSDPHELQMRLAFLARGDLERARQKDTETKWGDTETRNLAELADAATKLRAAGVPYEVVWARLKFTPQEIAVMKVLAGLPDRQPPGTITDAIAEQPNVQVTDPATQPAVAATT